MCRCLFMHVCSRVNMNQRADTRYDQKEKSTELIYLKRKWNIQTCDFDKIKEVDNLNCKPWFRNFRESQQA